MSFQKLVYTRDWENPTDFPTIQTNEATVRFDIQDLYNQAAVALNNLIDALEGSGGETGASNISASVDGLTGTNIQTILESIKTLLDTKLAITTAASTYETIANADLLIAGVTFNSSTGTFTFARQSGTNPIVVDTDIEKIAVNFSYDDDPTSAHYQCLILTLSDGSVKYIDLSALITQYEFISNTEITFTVGSDGKIQANISSTYKQELNQIKSDAQDAATAANASAVNANTYQGQAKDYRDEALQAKSDALGYAGDASDYAIAASGYAADALGYKTAAGNSATAASGSALTAGQKVTLAESWAVGGTGTRTGEDTNNAKYWAEQAAAIVGGDGTMQELEYDPTGEVKTAGGIVDYVGSRGFLSSNGLSESANLIASSWASLSADVVDAIGQVLVDHTDFIYKCELLITGVNADMQARVVFANAEKESGNYSGYCVTSEDKVTIYSKVSTSVVIPIIYFSESLNAGGPGIAQATYVYTQSSASDTWVIQHNLNMYPSVTVVDSAGTTVVSTVHYDSPNKITLTFSGAFAGTAYLN